MSPPDAGKRTVSSRDLTSIEGIVGPDILLANKDTYN